MVRIFTRELRINLFEKEAEKVESGIYELGITRDVFLAYSSTDIDKVISLCDLLEEQGISCFFSMRNLRHGRGAADNYDTALKTAMDNCLVVVFLSSKDSRNLSCDAFKKELQYMRVRDIENAPSEYRNLSYDKLPAKYKKPRVEYLLDDYKKTAADIQTKQIFDGYEWCMAAEDVAIRVMEYLSSTPNTEEQKANLEKSYDEVKTSVDRKEKNQLDHVKKLFELGYFADADQSLKGLEKEEVDELGVASAAVYYYKILSEHKTSSDDELIKMISGTGSDLKNDKNYILSRISGGGIYKTKIDRIEKAIEDINDARERSLQKKKRADEKERLRFLSIAERQKEKELQKQRRKQEREEKRNKMFAKSNNPYLTKSIVTFYSVFGGIALLGVILGLTVAGPAGASVLITDGCVMFVWFITSICLKNCRFAQALKTMPDGRAWIFITSILVLSIAFIVGGILFTPQFEREDESGFTYSVSARYCFVTGYNGTADTLEIPSKYKGKTVTKIQHDAFMDNTDLISVTIPDTVRVIKYNAFRNCTSLENVTMSGNVRKVKDYVFCQCESLTAIDLTGVKRIGAYAFDSSAVNDVVLSNSLKHIRIYAFNNCTSLEEITIPASVKRIWHDAFGGCVNLKSAIFEDPKGWKSTINDPISSDKLSNPATAASLLVDSDWKWRH